MKIKRIGLHNFGIYAGENEFVFDGEKSVVLVGGMNGRGKTTILEAVLLALYGKNSFAYTESKFQSYSRYLDSYVNKKDGTYFTCVELNFEMDGNIYLIKRSWEGNRKTITEDIVVYQNGKFDEFLTENWVMFTENLLPSGLSNFFFFDGEKIAELAADNTDEKLKDSIKTLLGIEILDSLSYNLNKMLKKNKKEYGNEYKEEISFELRKEKEIADQRLMELDNKIVDLEEELIDLEKQIEQARIEYTSKGGDIFEKKDEYFRKRTDLNMKCSHYKERLLDVAASELPLVLVEDLLIDIEKTVKKERSLKQNNLAIKKIKEFYKAYKSESEDLEIDKFIRYMEDEVRGVKVNEIYKLSDSVCLQLSELNKGKLDNRIRETNELFLKRNEALHELENTESLLSVEIDEEKIGKIYKKIVKLEHKKCEVEIEIEELRKERPHLNSAAMKANSEFNKYVESMLKKLEINDDYNRIVKYAHIASDVLDEYKIRLQEKKIGKLAETMTNCYKKLANKKGMIDKIKMNPVSLDLQYLNDLQDEIPKERLSAGEKQLMVVSLLWALAICSKRRLPVIIDTPLSRLDSKHRMSLINTYFPNASDQTIILSTDSEIYGMYYDALKKNVGNEYTLEYNDELKCTRIKRGYMWEVE